MQFLSFHSPPILLVGGLGIPGLKIGVTTQPDSVVGRLTPDDIHKLHAFDSFKETLHVLLFFSLSVTSFSVSICTMTAEPNAFEQYDKSCTWRVVSFPLEGPERGVVTSPTVWKLTASGSSDVSRLGTKDRHQNMKI